MSLDDQKDAVKLGLESASVSSGENRRLPARKPATDHMEEETSTTTPVLRRKEGGRSQRSELLGTTGSASADVARSRRDEGGHSRTGVQREADGGETKSGSTGVLEKLLGSRRHRNAQRLGDEQRARSENDWDGKVARAMGFG